MNLFTDRTYGILSNNLKKQGLSLAKACEWFSKLDIHVRRDVMKTGVVKFILDNKNEWNK